MKIYLVGGAIRDKILGIPVNDKDYLVVGSTPDEMVKLGYKPIFLYLYTLKLKKNMHLQEQREKLVRAIMVSNFIHHLM